MKAALTGTPVIQARGISAGYGSARAIQDVTIEVHPGEVVTILGANGAGKTTTLLSLVGELQLMSGDVLWDGSSARKSLHARAREGLCFVPDDGGVFRGLTVRQNLALCRHAERANSLAIFPELRRLLDRRGGLLSGGEQRMLAVGRALSSGTKLLAVDELSLGLAPLTVGKILRAIRRAADDGLGALIVEQHVHRILDVADRVYVMQRGRVKLAMSSHEARASLGDIRAEYLSVTSSKGEA